MRQGRQRRTGQTGPHLIHAVPVGDRTRSSLCGVRVTVLRDAWPGAGPLCPDCSSAAVSSSQTLPHGTIGATSPGRHRRDDA